MTLWKHHLDFPQAEPPERNIPLQTYQARISWREMVLWCLQSCKVQPGVLGADGDTEIQDKGCFSWEKALTGLPWVISKAVFNTSPPLSWARIPRGRNMPCTTRAYFSFVYELPSGLSRWAATYLACPVATPLLRLHPEELLMGHKTFELSLNPGWAALQRGLELDKGDPATCPGSWEHRQVEVWSC